MRMECSDLIGLNRGRIIGLDVGDKTVGVSLSDDRQMIASSHSVINRTSITRDLSQLQAIVENIKPIAIIYGWPLQTDGNPGQQCEKVDDFISKAEEIFELPFVKFDERFSTKVITGVLLDADMSRGKRKKVVDKVAATYILQCALDLLGNLRRNHA